MLASDSKGHMCKYLVVVEWEVNRLGIKNMSLRYKIVSVCLYVFYVLFFALCTAFACHFTTLPPFYLFAVLGAVIAVYAAENWVLLGDLKVKNAPLDELRQRLLVKVGVIHRLTSDVLRLEKLTRILSEKLKRRHAKDGVSEDVDYWNAKWHEVKDDPSLNPLYCRKQTPS